MTKLSTGPSVSRRAALVGLGAGSLGLALGDLRDQRRLVRELPEQSDLIGHDHQGLGVECARDHCGRAIFCLEAPQLSEQSTCHVMHLETVSAQEQLGVEHGDRHDNRHRNCIRKRL